MRLEDLDYDLPADRIAAEPLADRAAARLLVLCREAGGVAHHHVRDLPALLDPGDLLVLNDTRVLPARVGARRRSGGRVELTFLEPLPDAKGAWEALARAGGRLQPGEALAGPGGVRLVLLQPAGEGRWGVRVEGLAVEDLLARHGRPPLPPYIGRAPGDLREALDRERYQTVYAREPGAVAAPTAGLHFTAGLLAALADRGVGHAFVTLHVGLGTFAPVRVADLDEHPMHAERFCVPAATAAAVRAARERGGRVVAVGTTVVRALEAAVGPDGVPGPAKGRTRLLIQPGWPFRAVDALLTNFHLPRSTLLALVCALGGRERVLAAYAEAIGQGYRFYSYGDAMLLLGAPGPGPRPPPCGRSAPP